MTVDLKKRFGGYDPIAWVDGFIYGLRKLIDQSTNPRSGNDHTDFERQPTDRQLLTVRGILAQAGIQDDLLDDFQTRYRDLVKTASLIERLQSIRAELLKYLESEFMSFAFPRTKEAKERYVAAPFVEKAAHYSLFPFTVLEPPKQNPTKDLEFTLETSDGRKHLELMEVHLRDFVEIAGPTEASSYDVYGVTSQIFKGICAQSRRCQEARSNGVVLLIYVTHWQFCLPDPVLSLLSYWMTSEAPVFEQVFYVTFLDAGDVSISKIYPSHPHDFQGFDPQKYRGMRTFLLNALGWRAT